MDDNRKLTLKAEKLSELSMTELYAVIGDQAVAASVAARACEVISARLGIHCGVPTCGPGCTAVSTADVEQTHRQ